jgi:hypothetical protein
MTKNTRYVVVAAALLLGAGLAKAETLDKVQTFMGSLSSRQLSTVQVGYDDARRFDWHYYPEDIRPEPSEGLALNSMTLTQRQQVWSILSGLLSRQGIERVELVQKLERLLLDYDNGGINRDPLRYYFTVYGQPTSQSAWGLGFEGHHLTLNFSFEGERLISSSPMGFGANPETITERYAQPELPVGTRMMTEEEPLIFDFFSSLTELQRQTVWTSDVADVDPVFVGQKCASIVSHGMRVAELNSEQKGRLKSMIKSHVLVLNPAEQDRIERDVLGADIDQAMVWAKGHVGPGENYSFGIVGDGFVLEVAKSQIALDLERGNHVHIIWREHKRDFGGVCDSRRG